MRGSESEQASTALRSIGCPLSERSTLIPIYPMLQTLTHQMTAPIQAWEALLLYAYWMKHVFPSKSRAHKAIRNRLQSSVECSLPMRPILSPWPVRRAFILTPLNAATYASHALHVYQHTVCTAEASGPGAHEAIKHNVQVYRLPVVHEV